jgi:hypothetical protein
MIEARGKGIRELTRGTLQDGFMIHSGQPARDFIDSATRHVLLRQGVLGIKVKIMRGSDPDGKNGPQKSLPDTVTVIEPKEEVPPGQPSSQDYVGFPKIIHPLSVTNNIVHYRARRLSLVRHKPKLKHRRPLLLLSRLVPKPATSLSPRKLLRSMCHLLSVPWMMHLGGRENQKYQQISY